MGVTILLANSHKDYVRYMTHIPPTVNKVIYISSVNKIRGLEIESIIDITYLEDDRLDEIKKEAYYRLEVCLNRKKAKEVRLENEKKKLFKELTEIRGNWLYKLGRFFNIFPQHKK